MRVSGPLIRFLNEMFNDGYNCSRSYTSPPIFRLYYNDLDG
jgi:hypothetical protein